ncbi:uncharacterized protein LOC111643981 [Copidosoma floridanum]|uniref:uncharacterized protein LOC111643981 n=1 Tax=Copidosoma floridanum TaxID=29053 RepID=UPI000C6F9B0D|nr:uncharacterized protein LOC111643981 [Copidosoma floridanum]
MDKLHRSQTKLTTNITNFYDNSTVKVAVEKQTLSHFETRLGILENYWSTFISRHEDLLEYEEQLAGDSYFKDDVYSLVELAYSDAKARLLTRISELRSPALFPGQLPAPIINANAAEQYASLPRIALPTFSGKQEEWESFKQRFSSIVVSKATVPPIAKLQHLLNAVQGAAAQRLKGIKLTDANFELPAVKARNVADLNETMDRAEESVRALIDLGCPIEQTNYFVVHCVIRKLDLTSREAWEVSQDRTVGFPSYADLTTFLERRIHALEQAHVGSQSSDAGKANSASKQSGDRSKRVVANAAQTDESAGTTKSCVACKGNHYVNRCRDFKCMPVSQRWDLCKRERLCVNCLRASHFVEKCPSPNRCVTCDAKHHSKLHFERIAKPRNEEISSRASAPHKNDNPSDEPAGPSVAAYNALVCRTILLATAELITIGPNGKRLRIRALVDPGAERSFITHHVISELGLPCSSVNIKVVGVGGSASSTAHREAELKVAPRGESNLTISVSALVLPKLSQPLPYKHAFFESRQIDCILGADVYPSVIQDGTKCGPAGAPLAQNSSFGWLLTGPLASVETSNTMHVRAFHIHTDNLLAVELQKFWEIEEAPRKSLLTSDESKCEESFHQTSFRNADGRFVVKLPFQSTPKFSASRDIAAACFIRSEKRRHRDSDLAESYGSFMQDYIDQRHMEPEQEKWPTQAADATPNDQPQVFAAQEERPKDVSVHPCLPRFQKFSSFDKIVRMLAYSWRWRVRPIYQEHQPINPFLSGKEIWLATLLCFRIIQSHHFASELERLKRDSYVSARSPLRQLSPFIDHNGVIRVGGRLDHSALPYSERHLVILPSRCTIVRRLVEDTHQRTLHGGFQLMLSHLRRSVWILRGQRLVVGVLHRCAKCTRHAARSPSQLMGQLPTARVSPSRPFSHTDVEVTGDLALTPAHFLVGSALLSPPEPYDEAQRPMSPSNRWKLLVDLRNSFWSSWRKEVLHQHLKRCKWQTPRTNLQ